MAIGEDKPPVALIAGPTASGKSALALTLAQRTGGVVINADSAQLYRDLPILSAAPSTDDQRRAEHRLYGVRDGADPCSAADWAELARGEIAEVQAEGRLPILVGGTGLYLRTLLDGIAPVPPIDPAVRQRIRDASVEDNLDQLRQADPEAAERLNARDTTRIARALEVVQSTGRTLNAWQTVREGGIGEEIDLKALILLPPRPWLYERCNARFACMVEQGAVDEVKRLLAHNLDPDLPVMRAIGVREIGAYVLGECSLDEATVAGQQATRNYAKRQYTWFAHQPPAEWPRWTGITDPVQADGENQHRLGDGAFSSIVEALPFLQSSE
jgi:tRNA dimethylallyltransferase